jgi:curved DNA-binding protein CbpA
VNYYEILGVSQDATQAEIKKAYRRKSSENHPDKGGDAETMAQVNRAYECLGDVGRRRIYDETGADGQPTDQDRDAVSDVLSLLLRLIDAHNIESDLVALVQEQIRSAITQQKSMRINIERKQERLRRAAKKLKHKNAAADQHGLLTHLLFDRADSMDAEIEATKQNVERMERALALVSDYGWDIVQQLPGSVGASGSADNQFLGGFFRTYR